MAVNKNVAPAAAALLLALTMLRSTALAARHPPAVGEARLVLVPPFHGPVTRIPPPPATASADDSDDSSLRKVPRGPGHSPNDPSPPPPSSAVVAAKLPAVVIGEEVAAEHHPTVED